MRKYNIHCEYKEMLENGEVLKDISVFQHVNMQGVEKSAILDVFNHITEDFNDILMKEKEDAICSEGFDALNEDFDRRYFE